ncbi:hypothetical protein FACS1894133_4200 [Clostridia bacterium]|nr:hypothetical protein FACS1894133_4200 [Clostridia bacterium]
MFQKGNDVMSKVLSSENRVIVQNNVLKLLNTTQLMNDNTVNSPRAVGDAVQSFLKENFPACVPDGLISKFHNKFSRRAMADFAFEDSDGCYCVVDLKTHNLDTKFNRPNLTSVERLAKLYRNCKNYFALLLVSYKTDGNRLIFYDCKFVPIELLDWSCLTLGALGWGQIQITNSNNVIINTDNTRKKWLLQLCDALDLFYPKEIVKINTRIEWFRKVREYWKNQPD